MSWCKTLAGLALVLNLAAAPPADAGDGPGAQAVKKSHQTVTALLKQKPAPGSPEEKRLAAELSAQLKGFLDVAELGQRALGEHWKSLKPAQRREFLTLLAKLVEANTIKLFRSSLEYDVHYLREAEVKAERVVSTELRFARQGRSEVITVDYVLHPAGGALKAFDLVTDGVGLVENYRAQFNKIIAKEGFPGLLARMRKKHAQADAP
jgi:phospholipid transport system substrate-binding protein